MNEALQSGNFDHRELWPKHLELKNQSLKFKFDFGLAELPHEPGLIMVRGARQYGKSTWLELELRKSAERFGAGSTFYLNGDQLAAGEDLVARLLQLQQSFAKKTKAKRIFIDEITAIHHWEKALKQVLDQGLLRDVLIVTTGSKATDLRRGSERLPGRKGQLVRSEFIFLPVPYKQFHKLAQEKFHDHTWIAYMLTGGSPLGLNCLFDHERLPEFFTQLIRDWVFGEIIASGRNRIAFTNLISVIFKQGGHPVGFAKMARESGMANNTVATAYIEQLSDLFCVLPSWPWDVNSKNLILRKPCKFQFINTALASALYPENLRTVADFRRLENSEQAKFLEWLVAQEIWRRAVLEENANPEMIGFWASKTHEIDFVTPTGQFVEVKHGTANPLDFSWFHKVFPQSKLTVVCAASFESSQVMGMTIENFLLATS